MEIKRNDRGQYIVDFKGKIVKFASGKSAEAFIAKHKPAPAPAKKAEPVAKKEETILEDLKDGVPKKSTIEKIEKILKDKE